MKTKVKIVFYSMYGHTYRMTEAVAEGVRQVKDTEVDIYRVPELVPDEILEKSGAKAAQQAFRHIPIATLNQLIDADALLFGTPTRYGNLCTQMRHFIDKTDEMSMKEKLVNKIGSVYTNSQHAQETIQQLNTTLLHLGMIIVGAPNRQENLKMANGLSQTSYKAALSGRSDQMPTEDELAFARVQGQHVAEVTRALCVGKNK